MMDSYSTTRHAKILLEKLQQDLPEHTKLAVIADHIEMLCLLAQKYGYKTLDLGWQGINERLYEEGVLK